MTQRSGMLNSLRQDQEWRIIDARPQQNMSAMLPRHTSRPLVLACVMLALFIAAIEATIVATAMPQIVGKLGGFALYSWVFAAFLLTQTATTVLFGKLSDIYGRKPVMIAGILIFLVGSLLCGFAWSMPSMIVFRLIQGLGAGSMQPVAITIAGDIYAPRERLKIQGWLSAVWAIAALAGPIAGGLIVQRFSWSWVFWVNIPIAILTIIGFVLFMHEDIERKPHALDYPGAALFSVAITALLVALTQSATLSWGEIGILTGVLVLATGLFLLQERRTDEPMIALDLWGDRMIASANASLLLGTMTLIGVTSYLPVYIQAVQGRAAILAGIPLSAMLFAWPLASAVSGRILRRVSMRTTLRFGALLIPIGAAFLLLMRPDSSPAFAGVGPFIMGFGMGLLNITSMVMIQGSVEWSKRGSATASLIFSRTLGNTLGVTALGALLNSGVVLYASEHGRRMSTAEIHTLLGSIGNILGGGADPALRTALDSALRLTFWGMLAFAALAVVLAVMVPVRELETLSGGASEKRGSIAETSAAEAKNAAE
jgi:EmrB/QacA subfamily drug resistance transporter